jgi:hypothetical protein
LLSSAKRGLIENIPEFKEITEKSAHNNPPLIKRNIFKNFSLNQLSQATAKKKASPSDKIVQPGTD